MNQEPEISWLVLAAWTGGLILVLVLWFWVFRNQLRGVIVLSLFYLMGLVALIKLTKGRKNGKN